MMVTFRTISRSALTATIFVAGMLSTAVSRGTDVAAPPAQKHFASAEEAAAALLAAAKAGDRKALLETLGSDAEDVIDSGDPIADAAARDRFIAESEEANRVSQAGDAKAVLEIGKEHWPFPIPLVKEEAGWRFDTAAGIEAILDRRIGRNELSAMQASLAYVDAQREYYARNPSGSKLLHYAQKVRSNPGKRDGLFWETKEGEDPSPLGPLMASARAEGYGATGSGGKAAPYHGYLYKILTAQGPDAPGGAYDYMAHGEMIGGFGLVAYPAEYGVSGVMTFVVNHDGAVYEKDLGPKTAAAAQSMKTFNPDSTWKRTDNAVTAGQ